jgi:hypothetical protein
MFFGLLILAIPAVAQTAPKPADTNAPKPPETNQDVLVGLRRIGVMAGRAIECYRCGSSFIPPRSRTATGPGWSSTRYAGASRRSN